MAARTPWYGKARYLVPLILLAGLVALYLSLDLIARHYTQKALDEMKGFRGSFARVHVSPFALAYSIERLKIVEEPVTRGKAPLLYAEHLEARLLWRALLKLDLAAQVRVRDAKSTIDLT